MEQPQYKSKSIKQMDKVRTDESDLVGTQACQPLRKTDSLCEIKKKERKKTFKSREVFFSSASGVWGYRQLGSLSPSLW